MLQCKSTKNISELKKYFSSAEKPVNTILTVLNSLKISDKFFQAVDRCNTQYAGKQVFTALLLLPLFGVKFIADYKQNSLYQIFKFGKDVFYEFLNDNRIDWRKISYTINSRLLKRVEKHSEKTDTKPIRCLIADDTDLPKRGLCFELLSRIYSHVTHTFNYGYKGLFLGFHDGKSFFGLDFSLHGEKGNDPEKPYGLDSRHEKRRFTKQRSEKSAGKQRENEY